MDSRPLSTFNKPVEKNMVNVMAINAANVRSKAAGRVRKGRARLWIFAMAALMAATAATLAFDAYSGKLGIVSQSFEIVVNGANRIIKVPPGGNVQAAIEIANSGDIVELKAGAVYYGEIKLPNKPHSDFVNIQSSAASSLPADKRVGPTQKGLMAMIATRSGGRPAVSAANGAHHYRFVGIEFAASTADYNYGLVTFGSDESQVSQIPHDLEIDRSFLHPFRTGVVRRGIALNSASTTIKNSYIEGFGYPGEEAQGICGWSGTRNIRIINNYIEGGAENIMFGGSDPASAELIPMDIEIRGNHLNKPAAWNGKASLKTLFELKNAKRVQFTGILLTNNWVGSAFRITIRNQDGAAPFSTIEDVVIKDNMIDAAADGINILGKDDTHPSGTLKGLVIENNLFLNLGGGNGFDGSGYFIQIADGQDITIVNNTVFNTGNIVTFHDQMPRGFVFRDNITGHGSYGIHGAIDQRSIAARTMFQNNVFMNLNRVSTSDYAFPPGNTMVSGIKDVGFMDASAKDFRLAPSSPFRGKGRGGKNIGSDISPSVLAQR
jgi:hypothetical protein